MPSLEMELRRLGRFHAFSFDPLTHATHVGDPVDRDALGRECGVRGVQFQAPPEVGIAGDGARL